MAISMIPKELLENEEFTKSFKQIEEMFYTVLETAGKEVTNSIDPNMVSIDAISILFKTLTANICKEAFNNAYIRYISTGGEK